MSGYTPEQLREWADDWEKDAAGDTENWRRTVYLSHAAQLRAHATTLEQLSAAQAEIERLREDAERLNWVDDNFRNGSIRWLPRAFEKFHIKHNEVIYSGASFRAAIDKARRA